MTHIKGIDVVLYRPEPNSNYDGFGQKVIYYDDGCTVENVLVSPVSSDTVSDQLNLDGDVETYQLAIPKGDTNDWNNAEVFFFGKRWRVIGRPIEGMEHLIPLAWNKKVTVKRIYDKPI